MRFLCIYALILAIGFPAFSFGENAWIRFNPGPSGDATTPGYEDGWGVIDAFTLDTRLAEGQAGSFSITRPVDSSTGPLAEGLSRGEVFRAVDIAIPKSGTHDDPGLAVRLRLENVILVSQTLDWPDRNDRPYESLELAFQSITYVYFFPDQEEGGTFAHFDYEERMGEVNDFESGDPLEGVPPPARDRMLPRLTSVGAELRLTWDSVEGREYIIEYSPDLVTPFEPIDTIQADGDSTSVPIPLEGSAGFFRLRFE